jgi:dihydroorotase
MSTTIRTPDDFHVHLRDGEMLTAVAPFTASQFARALVMPNLQPPVRSVADASAYRDRIMEALGTDSTFQPLMTLYLTDTTTAQDIRDAKESGFVVACKLYPAGATTNSAHGVTSLDRIAAVLRAMETAGLVLCIHGESTAADVDVFDREAEFVKRQLPQLLAEYPALKIVLEHVTTKEAVDLVTSTPGHRLAATVTAHHLLYSRSAIFAGSKIHPHMFCLPVLKRETHRQALLSAILHDDKGLFFAGTDSAPHTRDTKLCASGCAGIFSAVSAVELYAEALDSVGALHRLEAFLSENGARFYDLPLNKGTITLHRVTGESLTVPAKIIVPGAQVECIVPLRAAESLKFCIAR